MPDDEKLEGKDEDSEEEEDESKEEPKVVSEEDFNKLKASLDGQISRERSARKRAEQTASTLEAKMSVLEKSLIPSLDEEDEDEDEEDESLFAKKQKKQKPSKAARIERRRVATLEEENTRLKEERGKTEAVRVIETRIGKLLAKTGVARGDPELDWAEDVDDPEEGFDRLMSSAILIAEKRKGQRAEAKTKVAAKKKQEVEKGGPKEGASSFLNRWASGDASKEEIEKVIQKGRRRTKEGASELDINDLTS